MFKHKLIMTYIITIMFLLIPPVAMAQNYNYQQYPQSQGYNYNNQTPSYNQGYNQGYSQDYNQGYNQNYNQDYNQNYNQQSNLPPLQGRVMVAPAGTSLAVTTTTALSSSINRIGDLFSTRLSNDLYIGGGLLLPAGSVIEGQVTQVESAGRTGRNGILGIRFSSAQTPNGQRVPISARIATEDGSGLIRGGGTAGRVGKTFLNSAIGAGIGAALGTALAPAAGGRVGRGAVYGTAIGGGAGLLSNLVRKGNDAELPSGTQLQIILDQPLSIQGQSAPSYNYGGYGSGY